MSRLPFTTISWSEYDSVSLMTQSPEAGASETLISEIITGVSLPVTSVTVISKITVLEVPLALVALTAT